jgi:hypothetical protein
MLPSPRPDRLGPRIVSLSRLQDSRHVAARVLASCCAALAASHAFDTRLQPSGSLPLLRVCYSALRRFPRRDVHPLDHPSMTSGSRSLRPRGVYRLHDAPCQDDSHCAYSIPWLSSPSPASSGLGAAPTGPCDSSRPSSDDALQAGDRWLAARSPLPACLASRDAPASPREAGWCFPATQRASPCVGGDARRPSPPPPAGARAAAGSAR